MVFKTLTLQRPSLAVPSPGLAADVTDLEVAVVELEPLRGPGRAPLGTRPVLLHSTTKGATLRERRHAQQADQTRWGRTGDGPSKAGPQTRLARLRSCLVAPVSPCTWCWLCQSRCDRGTPAPGCALQIEQRSPAPSKRSALATRTNPKAKERPHFGAGQL